MKLIPFCFSVLVALPLSTLSIVANAAEDHPSVSYPTNLPPSAQLHYRIKANKNILSLDGEADVNWHVTNSKSDRSYSITTETNAAILGKILQANSSGKIDSFGLAPNQYDEIPRNRKPAKTEFDRDDQLIKFSESSETYPLKGGEQDRTSVIWQLVSVARASADKFVPNSTWLFFVAGRRDAEKWTFTVGKKEKLSTSIFGEISAVHVIKEPPPDAKGQQIELWLAPGKEWYPVRLKFSDADGITIDQNLVSIEKSK